MVSVGNELVDELARQTELEGSMFGLTVIFERFSEFGIELR
jgi:hypothetical protein